MIVTGQESGVVNLKNTTFIQPVTQVYQVVQVVTALGAINVMMGILESIINALHVPD
jgi:hypothetical protein